MKSVTFSGGIHPDYQKDRTAGMAISPLPVPAQLIVPLAQHIGSPATPVVAAGDTVRMGQRIGEPSGFVSVPIHSPVSGTISGIEKRPGPLGSPITCVIIDNDDNDTPETLPPIPDPKAASAADIRSRIRDCGIAGLGGATFPTHIKLSPPANKPIDTVILNGAECEPCLTADHRMLLEHAAEIVSGLQIFLRVTGARCGIIGIEENKPDAIRLFEERCNKTDIRIVPLQVKYPQGGEKQLISAVLRRTVPSGGLPMDVGVVVQNVGTALAVHHAVVCGKPLYERVVTVTGSAVPNPGNFLVRIGTPVHLLLAHCGANGTDIRKLIIGGPMMGFAQYTDDIPVVRGTSGVLAVGAEESALCTTLPCIRCGRCVAVCPMRLVPSEIGVCCDRRLFDHSGTRDALDCMECGCCAFACPSRIPLVQKIRLVKSEVLAARRKERR